jgi:hypothetical protein
MKIRLFLLAALLPVGASAQGFGPIRWDYVTANLMLTDLNEPGFELDGSTAVTENLVVFGVYRDYVAEKHVDQRAVQLGVGRRWNVRPNIDVMLSASYGDNEIDNRGVKKDDSGLVLGFHARGWVTARMELNGAVMLDNSIGSRTETVIEGGIQFFRNRNWSYGGRIRDDERDTAVAVGGRFYFGASRR